MTIISDKYGFRFRDWDIYRDALSFGNEINKILKDFPKEERYALVNQAKRALNSIVLNIAEGVHRESDKDAKLFINRAHTSLDEVVACMDCNLSDGCIPKEIHNKTLLIAESLEKRLRSFVKYLSKLS